MKKKLTHEEKVRRAIMNNIKLKRIPRTDNKVRPIFHTCGMCKKNPVTDHHFLCNDCHKKKYKKKYADKKIKSREVKNGRERSKKNSK